MDERKHPVRLEREARRWSVERLANELDIDRKTILRVEKWGSTNPRTRDLLCDLFGRSADDLELVPRRNPTDGRPATPPHPSHLTSADHGPWHFTTDEARTLQAARNHYEQMYRQAGGITARPRIAEFLKTHRSLADDAYSDNRGREIYRTLGGLLAIAGICAYDSDLHDEAQQQFGDALTFAKASGDRAFGGYVHGLLVNQAVYAEQNQDAVELAERGIQTAGSEASPALLADLHGLQAKAFARMKQPTDAVRCMSLAETAGAKIRPSDEPPETGYVQPGLIETQLAEAFIGVRDLHNALQYAERAVNLTTHPRGQVNRLVTLTRVALASKNLEYAVHTTLRMIRLADGMESHRLRDRFQSIRTQLAQHQSAGAVRPVLQELDARLKLPL